MYFSSSRLLGLLLAYLFVTTAFAQTSNLNASTPDVEAKRMRKPSEAIGALGNGMFGEQVDFYGGDTSFSATDIDIPGNSGLKVQLTRVRKVDTEDGFYPLESMGDWELDVPHLSGIFANELGWISDGTNPNSRCSDGTGAPPTSHSGGGQFDARDYWQGYRLHVPEEVDEDLLLTTATSQNKSSSPARWTTKSHWLIECLPALVSGGTGQGFVATSPDGTRYYFDVMVKRPSGHRLSKMKQVTGTTLTPGGFCSSSTPITTWQIVYVGEPVVDMSNPLDGYPQPEADGGGGGGIGLPAGYALVGVSGWAGGATDCTNYT
ncbi:MAG: hypothetical protein ACREO1_15515, partial [Arenimonas sp.]